MSTNLRLKLVSFLLPRKSLIDELYFELERIT